VQATPWLSRCRTLRETALTKKTSAGADAQSRR
jgi:hypothetical protein